MPFQQVTIAILLISVATPVHAQFRTEEIYRLTEKGERTYDGIDQTLSFSSGDRFFPPKRWIVERIRRDTKLCYKGPSGHCQRVDTYSHEWIDGDACPKLVPALRELAAIPIPSFAGAGRMTMFRGPSHATVLTITGEPTPTPGHWPTRPDMSTLEHVSITEQVGAFATWWDNTEKAVSGCWQGAAPVVDGKRLQTTLEAPQ